MDLCPKWSTVVIGDTAFRTGARSVLSDGAYAIVHECTTVEEALGLDSLSARLIFVASPIDVNTSMSLQRLKLACPRSRVVAYALGINVSIQTLFDVFGKFLDGCLLPDAPVEVLRQSLQLVMIGEKVFPFSQLVSAERRHKTQPKTHILSERDREILQHLQAGKTNRSIAQELNLSEVNVKALVKALFRKIGVRNRTEAAVWALAEHRS